MREFFTSGTVGGALGNQRIYPELSTECRLVRENSQWLRIIDLSIKPKMSRLNFFDRFGCAIRTRRSTIQFFVKFGSVIYQI